MDNESEEKIRLELSSGTHTIESFAAFLMTAVTDHPDSNDLDVHAAAVLAQKVLATEQVFNEAVQMMNSAISTALPSVSIYAGEMIIPVTMTNVGMVGGQDDE